MGWDPEEKALPEGEQQEKLSYEDWYGKYVEGREPVQIAEHQTAPALIAEHQTAPALLPENNSGARGLTNARNSGIDVKDLYDRSATPGKGSITCDNGYNANDHKVEIKFADWLHSHYGGDIHLLNESTEDCVRMPDFIWNNQFWDLKTATTEKSANGLIRKGLTQIAKNPGGIFLDYGSNDISLEVLEDCINKRMQWHKGVSVDIMVIQNGSVTKVLRYKK